MSTLPSNWAIAAFIVLFIPVVAFAVFLFTPHSTLPLQPVAPEVEKEYATTTINIIEPPEPVATSTPAPVHHHHYREPAEDESQIVPVYINTYYPQPVYYPPYYYYPPYPYY